MLDTCITDDVMNEEGIGCDNITCTIVAICDNLNKNEPPLKKVQMVKKKSKQITENCDMDLRTDFVACQKNKISNFQVSFKIYSQT